MSIEVTVRDTETGDTDTAIVEDYLLIVADPCHLASRVGHPNGTHVLTVKNAVRTAVDTHITYEDRDGQ